MNKLNYNIIKMKIIFLYFYLISSFIYISLEENIFRKNKFDNNNSISERNNDLLLSQKEEKLNDETKILQEMNVFVNSITKKYENKLFNLTNKINNILNSSLEKQNEIIQRVNSENQVINKMLNEIKLLKEKYNRSRKHTYILIIIIIILFLFFSFMGYLTNNYNQGYAISGYHKANEGHKSNNQLSID